MMSEYYNYSAEEVLDPNMLKWNIGNCKGCVHKNSCGNKNKREANRCEKYRPEMRKKISKRKRR